MQLVQDALQAEQAEKQAGLHTKPIPNTLDQKTWI